jgi:hypothetical protein
MAINQMIDGLTYVTPGPLSADGGLERPPNRCGDTSTSLWCGWKDGGWITLVNRSGDRYAVPTGSNKSQRDFPHAAEAIHRKEYPIPADTCQRGEVIHRVPRSASGAASFFDRSIVNWKAV